MLVIPAYAKVNLSLDVVGRRSDGLHDIDSIVVPVDWHDLVGLRLTAAGIRLRVTGPAAVGVPHAESNLAARAARLLGDLAAEAGAPAGFDVWLDKRVPAGSGLGGGSADGGAVLRGGAALLHASGVDVSRQRLRTMAESLGSDVPAVFERRPLHVTGRGERLAPIDVVRPLHLVIVYVAPSSTAAAYAALRADEIGSSGRAGLLSAALAGQTRIADDLLGSALEPPALRVNAALAEGAEGLRRSDPTVRWHMTGSGGAFFSVAPDPDTAAARARSLRSAGAVARSCRSLAPSAA